MGGAEIGVADVVSRVTNQSKECPKQKFALVGYSQGGMVVSAAAPKIPKDLQQKVVAVVLYGAGDGNAKTGAAASADIKQKTMANCAVNDGCGKKDPSAPQGAGTGHLSYANAGTQWHSRSAKYIAASFHGQAQGYKLELSPT
jgi:cutinase